MDLLGHFAKIRDPRQVQWVDHPVSVVLALCAGAVVAGMRSFTAIAGWVIDTPADLLMSIYARCGRVLVVPVPPSKATIWRVLTKVDAASVDAAVGAWLWERGERAEPSVTTEPVTTTTATDNDSGADLTRPVLLAVDGKTVRGAVDTAGNQTHLLAAMTHHQGLVIAQTEVDGKTNEVRREVPCRISHSVRRNSEESSWIRRLTRIPKGEGDQSMPVQIWWSCPRVGAAHQGDPRDMANSRLRETQSPVMQVFIHRKPTCETGAALCVGLFRWPVQPP